VIGPADKLNEHNEGRFMKSVFMCLIAALGLGLPSMSVWAASDCDCPVIECGSCKEQVNLEFYTEKCGPGLKKVRSCKKPVCADKDPLPETCTAGQNKPKNEAKPTEPLKPAKPKAAQKAVGSVITAVGTGFVTHLDGEKVAAKVSLKIFEGDSVETEANGKVVIKLLNDNTINVVPSSKMVVQLHDTNESVHKTIINLMYGTVRSGVRKAPGNAKNDFRVKTPSAVAGVRGTDFVTSYTDKVGITKVETLHGLVELSSPSGKHSVDVPAGKYASYIVPSGTSSAINDDDIVKYVERGYMTDAQTLSNEDIARIEDHTEGENAKKTELATTSKDAKICSQPSAKLNQCLWTCESGADGACHKCIRKRCNANGVWAEETRLPASTSDHCSGGKPVIDQCDY
jgi:hypothetical protein